MGKWGTHIIPGTQEKNHLVELIQKIRDGDSRAEEALFQHVAPRIDFLVSHKLGTGNADWQDLANSIKMAVLLSLREGRFDVNHGTPLYAYIHGVAKNQISKYYRKKGREKIIIKMEQLPDFLPEMQQKFEIETKETRHYLKTALNGMTFKYRQVLYLKYFEEMSVKDIAIIIDIPAQKVSERLNYALKLLLKKVESENNFQDFM